VLPQVVVGAQVKAVHPILYIAAGGEHQHRQIFPTSPQARQYLETIHARQAHIENRHGVFLAAQGQVRRHAIVQHVHRQPRALERLGHTFGQLQMVFDEQDTHGFIPR